MKKEFMPLVDLLNILGFHFNSTRYCHIYTLLHNHYTFTFTFYICTESDTAMIEASDDISVGIKNHYDSSLVKNNRLTMEECIDVLNLHFKHELRQYKIKKLLTECQIQEK